MAINEKHSSKSFDNDLDGVVDLFLEMGRLAADQITKATHAVVDSDNVLAQQVLNTDDVIDQLEVKLDEQIILVVVKRQPTAIDLRLIMALSKGVVDLERIGDESAKIAQSAQKLIEEEMSSIGYSEIQHLSNQVRLMVLEALDAFISTDPEKAFSVLQSDAIVEQEYRSASRSLMTYVMEDSRHFSKVISIFGILRSLERIGDHARNIAELVIYLTSGRDVRHTDFEIVEQAVQEASTNLSARDSE